MSKCLDMLNAKGLGLGCEHSRLQLEKSSCTTRTAYWSTSTLCGVSCRASSDVEPVEVAFCTDLARNVIRFVRHSLNRLSHTNIAHHVHVDPGKYKDCKYSITCNRHMDTKETTRIRNRVFKKSHLRGYPATPCRRRLHVGTHEERTAPQPDVYSYSLYSNYPIQSR